MCSKLRLISNDEKSTVIVQTLKEKQAYQAELFGSWEIQQRAKGYTEKTITLSLRNVREFLDLVDKFIWEITAEDLELFYNFLVGKNLAHSTRRAYQSNISTFLEYLRSRKGIDIYNKLSVPVPDVFDQFNKFFHRKDDTDIRVVPPKKEIINQLFDFMREQMKHSRKYYTIARDYVFFKLLGLLGLRINELVMVDIRDVRFDLGTTGVGKIHVRYGKGSRGTGPKPRWVPLLNGADELIKWYLKNIYPHMLKEKGNQFALFLSENGERINRDSMRSNLYRRQELAGIPKYETFSAHQLRHAFATDLAEQGVDILTLSKLLGHSNIATTSGYLDPSSDYLETRIRLSRKKWLDELSQWNEDEKNDHRMEITSSDGEE